jgi:hypothetical protein
VKRWLTWQPGGQGFEKTQNPAPSKITETNFDGFDGLPRKDSQNITGSEGAGELPTSRCYACNSWLYWVSIYGATVCGACHPPANPGLVRRWYWLPEGESRRTQ